MRFQSLALDGMSYELEHHRHSVLGIGEALFCYFKCTECGILGIELLVLYGVDTNKNAQMDHDITSES